jgi:transcriptional regulator with XRE-family HTH domain
MALLQEKAVRAAMREHAKRNGKLLQTRRKALGLTQDQLADMAGVTQKAISLYELGLREPAAAKQLMIAAALACSVGDLWQHADRVEIATLARDVARGDAA